MPKPIDVFIAYARKDEAALEELVTHLALLRRQGLIRAWHDRQVEAGAVWEAEIREHLEAAQLILLLVSADFLASPSCWDIEMERAMERQAAGAARVIPILVRSCDWKSAPFGGLSTLPDNEKPIQGWADRDQAWTEVVMKIRSVMGKLPSRPVTSRPRYPDAETRHLAEELERTRTRFRALQLAGEDTSDVQREILELRRRLREGGQLRAGDRLGQGGRYLLLERAGRGGFANVWRARDDERNEQVAIKVLHTSLAEDGSRRERFFRGAQRMAALDHPGIVRVLEPHGEDGGFHFFVMELVSGGDLHQAVVQKRLAAGEVVPLILRIGDALREAHANGLVHRDVKPANILLEPSGQPRLTDFDLVAAADTTGGTRTGAALGTFLYSAPEVMAMDQPQGVDARADVYGLGMTALFCLYGAQLPIDVVHDRQAFVRELLCDGTLKIILEQAIAWKREKRFASIEEFCTALRMERPPRSARRSDRTETHAPVASAAAPAAPVVPEAVVATAAIAAAPIASEPAVASGRISAAPVTSVAVAPPEIDRRENVPEIEMVLIPGGSFVMGSAASEASARYNERPQRQVQITPFSMSKHAVTQRLYRQVMGTNPGQPMGDEFPVNQVSFWDAIEFCNRLSQLHGFTPAYRLDWKARTWTRAANGYRLPTEAEWEFAARGTDGRMYPWGNEPPSDQLVWSSVRTRGSRHGGRAGLGPVGQCPRGVSPFGLLDMAGNVWEWCWDWYGDYPNTSTGLVSNPMGPSSGSARVLRGGSWQVTAAQLLRVAARHFLHPTTKDVSVGFRCARGAQPAQSGASLGQPSKAGLASVASGGSPGRGGAPAGPTLPGIEAGLHELKILQGIWKDPKNGWIACAREHRGELRCVYSFKGNHATGEFLEWRLANDALIGRFQWITGSQSGYFYYRLESGQRLVGGWWYLGNMPEQLVSQLPHVAGMIPQTWVRQPSNQMFPAWAENFFSKLDADRPARR